MRRVILTLACTLLSSAPLRAADTGGHGGHGGHDARGPAPYGPAERIDPRAFFTGKTVSAVMFLPVSGPSSLSRVMFQAWLGENGTAQLRWWDERNARYSPVEAQSWSIDGSTFCLGFPSVAANAPLCFSVHMWGPNFQGHGAAGGGMIKGDVRPGRLAGL